LSTTNFFSFFGLPIAFGLETKLLKEKYYKNTKNYHPDYFGQENESKQAEMLALTTQNNNAYKTLKKLNSRIHYILQLYGLVNEGEKNTLSSTFLSEMMEINEVLMELEFTPDDGKLKQTESDVLGLEKQINEQLISLGNSFDNTANEEEKTVILQQIKSAYYKSKYILRLKETLHKFAAL